MKKSMLWILLGMIFLVAFNIVFFVGSGTQHVVSVWIAYGFIHFAYVMVWVTGAFIRKKTNVAALGLSLYTVSYIYFFIVLFIGIIIILLQPINYIVCFLLQVILAGSYLIVLIVNLIANEHTENNLDKHEEELMYAKKCRIMKSIIATIDDRALRKKAEATYDLLHASPVKSDRAVHKYEIAVIEGIVKLKKAIEKNDVIEANTALDYIVQNVNERNMNLKFSSKEES